MNLVGLEENIWQESHDSQLLWQLQSILMNQLEKNGEEKMISPLLLTSNKPCIRKDS